MNGQFGRDDGTIANDPGVSNGNITGKTDGASPAGRRHAKWLSTMLVAGGGRGELAETFGRLSIACCGCGCCWGIGEGTQAGRRGISVIA